MENKKLLGHHCWGLLALAIILLVPLMCCTASSIPFDDGQIHTEYVDRNNKTILAMFNLTEEQMNRIQSGNKATQENGAAERGHEFFDVIKVIRVNDIRDRIKSAILMNSDESFEQSTLPMHEMAAYPICNSDAVESSWMQGNNVTMRFPSHLFEPNKLDNLSLDSGILRLYKVNPNPPNSNTSTGGSESSSSGEANKNKRCSNPVLEKQIRVTISVVHQMRRNKRSERKKRICNTIMMSDSKTGWVEIDIKRAIYIWEEVERQQQLLELQEQGGSNNHNHRQQQQQSPASRNTVVGLLMIEVHDEEESPLKPGSYFKPPNCEQADVAIPWNYYRPGKALPPNAAKEVPRYPRLDVKLSGYASTSAKHNKGFSSNMRQHMLEMRSRTSQESSQESSTVIAPGNNYLDNSSAELNNHRQHKRHLRHHTFAAARGSHGSRGGHHHSNTHSQSHHRHHQNQQQYYSPKV